MRMWSLCVSVFVMACNTSPAPSGTAADKPASAGVSTTSGAAGFPDPSGKTEAPIRTLVCTMEGKRLGTLRFPEGAAPVLTLDAQGADAEALKANWEKLFAQGKIQVKFHEGLDDDRPLVGLQAAPGAPQYGRVVQLKLAEQYGYACHIEPPAD